MDISLDLDHKYKQISQRLAVGFERARRQTEAVVAGSRTGGRPAECGVERLGFSELGMWVGARSGGMWIGNVEWRS